MINIVEIRQTCMICPSQWEGRTADGRFVYVRFRWGYLQVGIGATDDEAVEDDGTFGVQLSDHLDGALSYQQLVDATLGLFTWPVGDVMTNSLT